LPRWRFWSELYSPYTVVAQRDGALVGIPYHEAHQPFLNRAAGALREAAGFSDDGAFAQFLRLRADQAAAVSADEVAARAILCLVPRRVVPLGAVDVPVDIDPVFPFPEPVE
jgi:hypothetical protein